MKKILTLISLCCALAAYGQPTWLKEVAATAKGKPFDKKATVAVLHHSADIQLTAKPKSISHIRWVYQVLLPTGKDQVIFREIGSPTLSVANLQGWAITDDGQVHELAKDDIFKVNPIDDAAYYGDSYAIIARPAKIETGAIVAYEYDLEETGFGSLFQTFDFQEQHPVLFAQVQIRTPKAWQVKTAGLNVEDIKVEEKKQGLCFTAQDLPYQPEEPLMPPWYWVTKRLYTVASDPSGKNAKSADDWNRLSEWYLAMLEKPNQQDQTIISETRKIIAGCKSKEERLFAISRFMQEKIRYVAVEIGKGAFKPRPASETLYHLYGDCKDKSTLMCAMLAVAGIEAVPALTNTTYPVLEKLPSLSQFDHVIVAVSCDSLQLDPELSFARVGNWLFIDPTDPLVRMGDLPVTLQGSHALPISKGKSELCRLPYSEASSNRQSLTAKAFLQKDGSMRAQIHATYYSHQAYQARYRNQFLTLDEQVETWRRLFENTVPLSQITDYQTGKNADSCWITFTLQSPAYLVQTNKSELIKPDFFHKPSPFILVQKARQHDIWFGPPMELQTHIIWHLPSKWTIEPVECAVAEQEERIQLDCSTHYQDSTLVYQYHIRKTGRPFAASEYALAQRINEKASRCDGLTLILQTDKPCAQENNR